MFIKENIFKLQNSKYHPTHVYKRKKLFPDKSRGGGPGPPGLTPTSALGVPVNWLDKLTTLPL